MFAARLFMVVKKLELKCPKVGEITVYSSFSVLNSVQFYNLYIS